MAERLIMAESESKEMNEELKRKKKENAMLRSEAKSVKAS
jgi:Fe-S cluster assembly iron-binding protein IscA